MRRCCAISLAHSWHLCDRTLLQIPMLAEPVQPTCVRMLHCIHYGAVVNTPLLRSEALELQCDTMWLQLYLADTNFVRGPEKPLPASYFLCCLRADQCQYAIEAQTAESIV